MVMSRRNLRRSLVSDQRIIKRPPETLPRFSEKLEEVMKSAINPFGSWVTPEEHLAAIENYTKEMHSKYLILKSQDKKMFEGLFLMTAYLNVKAKDLRNAIAESDVNEVVWTGIELAYVFYALGKMETLDQQNKAIKKRHEEKNRKKEAWLADALAELRQMVAEKAEPRPSWHHTEYLTALYENHKKFKKAEKQWKEKLRCDFIEALKDPADLNRPNLIRGLPKS